MKKLFSLILALAMAFAMCVPAFAENIGVMNGNFTLDHDITTAFVSINEGTLTIPAEYSLDMTGLFYMDDPAAINVYGKLTGTTNRFCLIEDDNAENQIKVFDGAYVDFTYPAVDEDNRTIPDDCVVYAGTDASKAAKLTITDNGNGTKTAKFDDRAPAGPQTNVTMNITKNDTYTLTVPATVPVNNSGFNALDIKVDSDNDMSSGKKVVVTASSNEWKLKDGTKEVPYILVANSNATTETKVYDFAAADINPTGGKTVNAGVYVTEANYKAADAGSYTDTITFTAAVQ